MIPIGTNLCCSKKVIYFRETKNVIFKKENIEQGNNLNLQELHQDRVLKTK